MDYTDAIKHPANAKEFEYPRRGHHDLQSEHERYLAEKHVKGTGRADELPEGDQGLYMRLPTTSKDGRSDGRAGAGHRRDHRRFATRGTPRRA